ncbi:unnamed protein product [Rhodiola kirilowii]
MIHYALLAAESVKFSVPEIYEQALHDKHANKWVKAMHEQIQSMIKEGNDLDEPPRFKASLVDKGFTKKEGIDFNEIFAPVVKYKTMRLLIAMAAVYDWEIEQMDVKTAFLHGDLEETIYMNLPVGFIDKNSPDFVCLLNKLIYGLKQSPRQWNKKFDSCMLTLGFTRSRYDTCMYMKVGKSDSHILGLLYVDDILLMSHSIIAIADVKELKKLFDKAQKILGMKIIRNRHDWKICLFQVDYVAKVLDKFAMKDAKPSPVPLGGHLEILKDDYPNTNIEKQKMEDVPYDVAVGSLVYVMLCTRPDITFVVSVLSRYMSNPGEKHWIAMKYLLKYTSGTKKLGLVYADYEKEPELKGYVDSDFCSNKDTRKSVTSFFFTWVAVVFPENHNSNP